MSSRRSSLMSPRTQRCRALRTIPARSEEDLGIPGGTRSPCRDVGGSHGAERCPQPCCFPPGLQLYQCWGHGIPATLLLQGSALCCPSPVPSSQLLAFPMGLFNIPSCGSCPTQGLHIPAVSLLSFLSPRCGHKEAVFFQSHSARAEVRHHPQVPQLLLPPFPSLSSDPLLFRMP